MSRLVVVSNRVNVPRGRENDGAQGGLAVALTSALRENDGLWFGWSGSETDQFDGTIHTEEHQGVATAVIDLEQQDIDEYYNGYANRSLWPLFHYRIDIAHFDRNFGRAYERVNERFSRALSTLLKDDDLVWVHDYHFLPMARDLRREGVTNKIGFFLHTPWPPHRLMKTLPFHRRLVRAMLEYDLLGFQNDEWRESFLHFCEREFDAEVNGEKLCVDGRSIIAATFPIGIDHTKFAEMATGEDAMDAMRRVRDVAGDEKVIVGVDRLDYSKGLLERFNGYRQFLAEHEEWQQKCFLIQIAPPSRGEVQAYADIRNELDMLSGRINGEYARADWVPIRYVNHGYPRSELAGIFRASDVGMVTPLRDGMNLVAKEYVAAQDSRDPGVLILSEFAGAAAQLDAAILVNPHSNDELADALEAALTMPLDERRDRWQAMWQSLENYDVFRWSEEFIQKLKAVGTT